MGELNKNLSMKERWDIDIKSGATFQTSSPQCKECSNLLLGSALQCRKFKERKPNYVLLCKKECPEFNHKNILNFVKKSRNENQLLGGVFGACVGDALGVPVEFKSREDLQKDPVQEMRAYGTHHQPFGTWSDDSSMTLCLLDSLKNGYNEKDISNKLCEFYFNGFWTPNNEVFDIGNTTRSAIERMKIGINPIECGGSTEKDNGNGSLMRILPLAFYLKNAETKDKIKIIEEVSSLTHSHKRSKLACIFYIELVINLLNGLSKEDAYKNSIEFISENCKDSYEHEFVAYSRLLNGNIDKLPEDEIKSSGYVVDTLEASVWSFLTSNSYKDSILKAINLGEDTDTVAAIVGGIAGIFYGINEIPPNWVQCLARKNDIYNLCVEFSENQT